MRRGGLPPRRDCRITSQYIPSTGDIVIGVARGFTGSGEVLLKLEPEKLAGAVEDRRELAVIINNLGLLALAQLTGFNLAENLEGLPKALAKWAHIDRKVLERADAAEALRIAQQTIHSGHGNNDAGDGPDGSDCGCNGTDQQTICAEFGCGFCLEAEAMAQRKETNEGHPDAVGIRQDDGPGDASGSGDAAVPD